MKIKGICFGWRVFCVFFVIAFNSVPVFGDLLAPQTIAVPGDYSTIQAAINAASDGYAIFVADGVYYENINFNGKAIAVLAQHGPDVTIIDGKQNGSVVTFDSGENENSVLDGFTITNGSGSIQGDGDTQGGGIRCYLSSPTINNCIITKNTSTGTLGISRSHGFGGGIYCAGSSAIISNCSVTDNVSTFEGGGLLSSGSTLTVTNCKITNNQTLYDNGGGMSCNYSSLFISDCIISNNLSGDRGGGIWFGGISSPIITNCVIVQNIASRYGGGIHCFGSSIPSITNCTISGNIATQGGGIYCAIDSFPSIVNTIFWGNGLEIYADSNSNPILSHCNIQGGWPGTDNINADPLFVDPSIEDFHLNQNSPCIDSGTSDGAPDTDIEGNYRPQDSGHDMGAYEYVSQQVNQPSSQIVLQPGPGEGKDIWTTSVFSYAPGGGGPGGGLDNYQLKVGGWGDLYYSLIEFDLTALPTNITSVVLYLYNGYFGDHSSTGMYLDRNYRAMGLGS